MASFFTYIIAVAICMVLFILINKLLLEKETFHTLNRFGWLFAIALPMLFPLIDWNVFVRGFLSTSVSPSADSNVIISDAIVLGIEATDSVFSTFIIYMINIYIIGCAVFAVKLLLSYISLYRLLRNNKSLNEIKYLEELERSKNKLNYNKHVNLIVLDKSILPFSWMNNIVISKEDIENNGEEILVHELAHIYEKHSYDILFLDVITIFMWFNPALWIARRELTQVHEYSADAWVLKTGIDAKQYQMLLIKKAVGQRLYTMANNFNHSKLKKRITMMLKSKSKKWAIAKYLYALPLALITVSAFSNSNVVNFFNKIESVKDSEKIFSNDSKVLKLGESVKGLEVLNIQEDSVVTKPDVFPQPPSDFMEWMQNNVVYPQEARDKRIEGRVFVGFVVEKDGSLSNVGLKKSVHPLLDAEALRAVKALPKFTPGQKNGEAVRVNYVLPVYFKLESPKLIPEDKVKIEEIKEETK